MLQNNTINVKYLNIIQNVFVFIASIGWVTCAGQIDISWISLECSTIRFNENKYDWSDRYIYEDEMNFAFREFNKLPTRSLCTDAYPQSDKSKSRITNLTLSLYTLHQSYGFPYANEFIPIEPQSDQNILAFFFLHKKVILQACRKEISC